MLEMYSYMKIINSITFSLFSIHWQTETLKDLRSWVKYKEIIDLKIVMSGGLYKIPYKVKVVLGLHKELYMQIILFNKWDRSSTLKQVINWISETYVLK